MHDSSDVAPFGFIHPENIIRGAHIIPAFHYGLTTRFLPYRESIAHPSLPLRLHPELQDEVGRDYNFYYLGGYVFRFDSCCDVMLD